MDVVLRLLIAIIQFIAGIIVGVLILHLLVSVNTVHISMGDLVLSNYENNVTKCFDTNTTTVVVK